MNYYKIKTYFATTTPSQPRKWRAFQQEKVHLLQESRQWSPLGLRQAWRYVKPRDRARRSGSQFLGIVGKSNWFQQSRYMASTLFDEDATKLTETNTEWRSELAVPPTGYPNLRTGSGPGFASHRSASSPLEQWVSSTKLWMPVPSKWQSPSSAVPVVNLWNVGRLSCWISWQVFDQKYWD